MNQILSFTKKSSHHHTSPVHLPAQFPCLSLVLTCLSAHKNHNDPIHRTNRTVSDPKDYMFEQAREDNACTGISASLIPSELSNWVTKTNVKIHQMSSSHGHTTLDTKVHPHGCHHRNGWQCFQSTTWHWNFPLWFLGIGFIHRDCARWIIDWDLKGQKQS